METSIMEKLEVIQKQVEDLQKLLADMPTMAEQIEQIVEATVPPLPTELK